MRTTSTGAFASGRLVRSVRCNRTVKHLFFTSGVHYWEVFVTRMCKRASMVIGAVPSELFDSETLNGPLVSWTDGAVGYAAHGAIIKNGVEVETRVNPFHEGDVVGVQLDLNTRTVSFFLNGREVARHGDGYRAACLQKKDAASAPLPPIKFAPQAMFAGVTFAPDSDDFDIYSTPLPPSSTA